MQTNRLSCHCGALKQYQCQLLLTVRIVPCKVRVTFACRLHCNHQQLLLARLKGICRLVICSCCNFLTRWVCQGTVVRGCKGEGSCEVCRSGVRVIKKFSSGSIVGSTCPDELEEVRERWVLQSAAECLSVSSSQSPFCSSHCDHSLYPGTYLPLRPRVAEDSIGTCASESRLRQGECSSRFTFNGHS